MNETKDLPVERMSRQLFESLPEYSCGFPSGKYIGKKWKRQEVLGDLNSGWLLGEYVLCSDPELIAVEWRRIKIDDVTFDPNLFPKDIPMPPVKEPKPAVEEEVFSSPLDPRIESIVRKLRENGVETFESCQGGPGHAFPEPTVRFHGPPAAGHQALSVAMTYGLPVFSLRRYWTMLDGELTGPQWEMTFTLPEEKS